jgi:flagellar protein FliO/FliZ
MNVSFAKIVCGVSLACLTLSANLVLAAEEKAGDAPVLADPNIAGNLIQTTLGLLVVLLLIGAAAWGVKRFGGLKMGAAGRLKIVGGLSLGTRERVVLLEVGDQQLVLGVAPGQIRTLHVLDTPLPAETREETPTGFADRLQAAMTGKSLKDAAAGKHDGDKA